MHSRIFQVSYEPIDVEDYLQEYELHDTSFIGHIADYVCASSREADIERLKDCALGYEVGLDENGEDFIITDKKAYFESAYKCFRKALGEIYACSLDDFTKEIPSMWNLNDAYEDEFGFYVYTDYPIPFDEFVRNSPVGQKFYIGGTVDYHF